MVNLMFLGSISGRLGAWGFLLLGSFLGGLGGQGRAIAQLGHFNPTPLHSTPVPRTWNPLITRMLPDLPAYTNRTHIRLGIPQHYLILAGRLNLNPSPSRLAQNLTWLTPLSCTPPARCF